MPKEREVHWSDRPTDLMKHHKRVRNNRGAARNEGATYLQMYHNRPAVISSTSAGYQVVTAQGLRDLGFNVLAEAVDGAVPQVCKPMTAVVTPVGGTWETRQACDNFGLLLNGLLEAQNFLARTKAMRVEAALVPESNSIWEPDPVTKNFRCVALDPMETFWSQDRTEFTTLRAMNRRWVKAAFGGEPDSELSQAIDLLRPYHSEHVTGVDAIGAFDADDTIAWYEGFILPVGKLKGKHVVQLSKDIIIIEDEWEYPIVPVISAHWGVGHRGESDGKPGARTIAPFMAWENEMHLKMQDSLAGSVPMVSGPEGTKTPSDVPFQFVEVPEGADPGSVKIYVPNVVSKDVREHARELHESALRASGVSEQAAAGTAPPQFKSGVALSRWKTIVNERLSNQHTDHQNLYTQSGRILAILGPKYYGSRPVNVRRAAGSEVIEQIKWSELDLPEKSYQLSFETVSQLGDTVAQRLENLEIIKDLGGIDVPQMLLHLDIADLRAVTRRLNGPRNYLEKQIHRALYDGVVEPPISGMQEPQVCSKQCAEAYLAALAIPEGAPKPPARNMNALRVLWRLFLNLGGGGLAAGAPEPTTITDLAPTQGATVDPAAMASPGPLPTATGV